MTVLSVLAAPAGATLFIDPTFGVSTTLNVQYGTSPDGNGVDESRFLDLYQPTGTGLPTQSPAIVLMHGGYFTGGDKSAEQSLAMEFATRGYVVVSINYRLLLADALPNPPGAPLTLAPSRYPSWLPGALSSWGVTAQQYANEIGAAVADQAMAFNWLAGNAGTYGVDSKRIAVGGFSAGAVSSLLLGADAVDGVSADVGAVFSIAGGMFGLETFVDGGDPGVFILHGTADTVIPYTEVGFLETALTDAGVPFAHEIVPGGGHSDSLSSFGGDLNPLFEFMIGQLDAHAVPEPSTFVLGALVGAALVVSRRRLAF
jgi:acetyl esterase/lipase